MSNIDEDKKFRETADAFIALANKYCKNENPSMVNASFLYAAARFNIFIVAASSGSGNEFAAKKEDVINNLAEEYKKMLEEHFENYKEHFDEHLGR